MQNFGGGILRVDALAAQIDAREIEFCPAPKVGIDALQTAVKRIDGLLQPRNFAAERSRIEALHFAGDFLDRMFERVHLVLPGGKQRDRQRADRFGKLFPQHRERRIAHRSHQHAAAIGQPVTNDVGDGVGLTRARRSLHHHAIGSLEQLDDASLLIVEGLRKKQIPCRRGFRCRALVVRGTHAPICRQPMR